MNLGLTDEEISKVWIAPEDFKRGSRLPEYMLKAIREELDAQLKKVVEWLFGECEDEEHEYGNSGCEFLRYECKECRQALFEEVKE